MTDWKNWVEREMIQKDVELEELFFWNLFVFPWWCSGWDPILPIQDIWVQSLLVHTILSCFNHVQLCVTLWTTAYQAPLSMGFSRQEYWSGLPCPPPEDLPNPGIEPKTLMSFYLHWQVGSLPLAPPGKPQSLVRELETTCRNWNQHSQINK